MTTLRGSRTQESFEAAANLSAQQYRAVSLTAANKVGSGTDGGIFLGVLENAPDKAGAGATVTLYGITRVRAGAAVTALDVITPQADGSFIGVSSGEFIAGQAHTTAASGYMFTAEIYKGGYKG